jgi:transposase-like protein
MVNEQQKPSERVQPPSETARGLKVVDYTKPRPPVQCPFCVAAGRVHTTPRTIAKRGTFRRHVCRKCGRPFCSREKQNSC